MTEDLPFFYPASDFLLNVVGLIFFLLDVVLDICTVVDFYQKQEFVSMGVLIFLLLGSSALLQVFSWLWYSYSSEEEMVNLKKYIYLQKYFKNRCFLKVLHACQVGVLIRFLGVMEISLRNLTSHTALKEGIAVYLSHDLSLLRLIETFTESVPQLTLMIAVICIKEDLEWTTGLKTLGSFATIAYSVLMYHRSMRAFAADKTQLTWRSSAVYFVWNLFLIIPRVAVVGLVASALPWYIIVAHFLGLCCGLLFWAWRQKTDFMEHATLEWLYRATVALIWYFSWFNVSKGRSKGRSIVYHSTMAVDTALLLVLWMWWEGLDDTIFGMPVIGCFTLMVFYVVGILGKILYYKRFHPRKTSRDEDEEKAPACFEFDVVDIGLAVAAPSQPPPLAPQPLPLTAAQRRMQKMAGHFFS